MSMESVIDIRHLRKSFGAHEVLKDIDFSVGKGEVACIIGSSARAKARFCAASTCWRRRTPARSSSTARTCFRETCPLATTTPRGHGVSAVNLFNNMTVLKNCMVGQMKVLKRNAEESRANALKYLQRVGMERSSTPSRASSPADRSSAWPSPAPWPWTRKCCSLTSRPRHSTRKWSARCWRSCRDWQKAALPCWWSRTRWALHATWPARWCSWTRASSPRRRAAGCAGKSRQPAPARVSRQRFIGKFPLCGLAREPTARRVRLNK